MNNLSNLTKEEAVEFLIKVIATGALKGDISDIREDLETAIRIAIGHLTEGDTNKVATAIDAIFQMYRRNDVADKSYRNAARFILSAIDGVPNRYETYECYKEDTRLTNLVNNKQGTSDETSKPM